MTLELQGVSRSVGGRVHIHPTDLTLKNGTMNVFLGPTLSGKTSLMRLMAGLDKPSTGRILWEGTDVTGQRVQDHKVAMVYQQFINYPGLTVYENIASPLRLMGKASAEIDRACTALAARVQREANGALARALVKGAGLVLVDEPLANLDYKLREELRIEIPRIFEASGAIFVYAITGPEEALLLGGNTAPVTVDPSRTGDGKTARNAASVVASSASSLALTFNMTSTDSTSIARCWVQIGVFGSRPISGLVGNSKKARMLPLPASRKTCM